MRKIISLNLITVFIVGCTIQPHDGYTPTLVYSSNTSSAPAETIIITKIPVTTLKDVPIRTADPVIATADAAIESCASEHNNKYVNKPAYSSNGQWTAIICQDNGVYTRVSNPINTTVWDVPAIDDEDSNLDPGWYLQPYRWSDDEKYLYLIPICFCSIDSPSLQFVNGFGLYRLNLADGKLDTWFKPYIFGYSFSFSPNDQLFAFRNPENPHQVRIRNLVSGTEAILTFEEKYVDIGQFIWTSDSSEVIIVTGVNNWISFEDGFSLFLYDLHSNTLTLLVNNDIRQLYPFRSYPSETNFNHPWLSNEILLLREDLYDRVWTLNIRTGELSPYATPIATSTHIP